MLKYGVKLMLWKNDPTPTGLFAVYLRIRVSGVTKYLSTGIYLADKYWDPRAEQVKEGHPMHAVYNPDLTSRKQMVIRAIVDRQMKGETITAGQVKEQFSKGRNLHNIFDFVAQFSEEVFHKRTASTIDNYRKHALKLEQYHGSKALCFEDITPDYLKKFEADLRKTVGNNYTSSIWSTIRTFFNAAIKRKVITCYPFDEYENPEYEAPVKAYLTLPELARWEKYAEKVKDNPLRQTAAWFLLGCYSGLRISDWLTFDPDTHITGDRILLHAKKNGEQVTMPLSAPLKRAIARIRACPLTIEEPTINRLLKTVAKDPAVKINKHLTTHCARHTFFITICAEQGIGVEVAAELGGITVKVCAENYYRVSNKKIMDETRKAWESLK